MLKHVNCAPRPSGVNAQSRFLSNHLSILKKLERDVASFQGCSPLTILNEIDKAFSDSSENVQVDTIFPENEKLFHECQLLLKRLIPLAEKADHDAKQILLKYRRAALRSQKYLGGPRSLYDEVEPLFSSKISIFDSTVTAQRITWDQIKPHLQELSTLAHSDSNALSILVSTEDDEFLRKIQNGQLAIGEEIGHLVIQRLHDISQNNSSNQRLAKRILKQYMAPDYPESLYAIDYEALEKEIAKLIFNKLIHPELNTIWLGSARMVDAMINQRVSKGMYLNSSDSLWSWALNRAWLQTAIALGYEFKLVEQHFPNIEEAILSGNSHQLITELVREAHATGTSQYNGGDAPTATPQELLVLMDMRCVARKSPDDNALIFGQPKAQETPRETTSKVRLTRTHSSSHLFKAAPLPSLPKRQDHFSVPPSSPEIRKSTKTM